MTIARLHCCECFFFYAAFAINRAILAPLAVVDLVKVAWLVLVMIEISFNILLLGLEAATESS